MLKTGKVPYEFRTTLVPELVTPEDAAAIGKVVQGAKTHALQQFLPSNTLDKKFESLHPYAPEVIEEFAQVMQKYAEQVILRV